MPGSIAEFKSSFSGDLARQSRFDVNIPVPISIVPYIGAPRLLRYRCETAELPGKTLATTEQRTYGPIEKFPYLSTFNDIDLTFIIDDNMESKVFFDAWMNYINPTYNYDFKYKESYATTITVNQYDVRNKQSYSVDLIDAYPISMNQLSLDWNSDSIHKLTVTFAYTSWRNNSLQALGMELAEASTQNIVSAKDLGSGIKAGVFTVGNVIRDTYESLKFKSKN
jgi:hypothetical protein